MSEAIKLLSSDSRLSQAFPPNSQSNSKYIAECHSILHSYDINSIKCEDITYRPIQYKRDIAQLKQLQQEWFPINYSEAFYKAALAGITQSVVAEVEIKFITGRKEKLIVGAMVYQSRPAKGRYYSWREWREWISQLLCKSKSAIYIMTLGVINEFRGRGIAERMLQQLYNRVQQSNGQILYIYLDMVVYNKRAAKFYDKQGFTIVRTKLNHYNIEDQIFDAYVYMWKPSN